MSAPSRPSPVIAAPPPALAWGALALAALGLGACAVGALLLGAGAFFPAYLVGVLFWIEIAFGCLAIQLLHALTGGGWGLLARRPLHAASSTMPALALLFVPLLLGLRALYPWASPALVAHDPGLQQKASYLSVPFFAVRAALCFALWSGLALALFDRARARVGKESPGRTARRLAGPGMLASGLTMSVAAMDWIMSIEPRWFSTIFGLLVISGCLVSGVAFVLVAVTTETPDEQVPRDRLHDLGNLLLVFVLIWAYFAFSQYLIIYSGDLAEDVPFYVHRTAGGFQYIALGLIALHFAMPLCVLLTRRSKRSPRVLRALAAVLLAARLAELIWFVAPDVRGHDLRASWMYLAAAVGVGGLWLFCFLRRLRAFTGPALSAPPPEPAGGAT